MTKFWSNALFYKEKKTIAGMVGGLAAILIMIKIYPLMSALNRIKEMDSLGKLGGGWSQWFEGSLLGDYEGLIPIMLFMTVALVISLFRHDRQEATGDLLASMPFTKKQIIGTKWLTGALAITVPFALTFVILSAFYWINIYWIITPYSSIPLWTLLNLAVTLTIFSFLFLVQTLMGQNTYGGIVGAICLVIPGYLFIAIPQILGRIINNLHNPILQAMERVVPYTLVWQVLSPGRTGLGSSYYYPNFTLKIGILLLAIVIFYMISVRAYRANPLEKNGELLMFSFLEPVLIWGFAICLGLLFPTILGLGYNGLPVALLLALGTAIGYFIARGAVAITKDK